MINEREVRSTDKFEIREIGEGKQKEIHIQGYALTFDSISEDLGFKEVVVSGALANCDLSDVVLNINHDNDRILARNTKSEGVGSLTLTVDEKGLFFDAIPTNTTYARDLIENMNSGIIGKCSFAFELDWEDYEAQSWDWDNGNRGYDFRTINKIARISDCSIVVNPAYESTSTSVYKRSKDTFAKDEDKPKKKDEEDEIVEDVEKDTKDIKKDNKDIKKDVKKDTKKDSDKDNNKDSKKDAEVVEEVVEMEKAKHELQIRLDKEKLLIELELSI